MRTAITKTVGYISETVFGARKWQIRHIHQTLRLNHPPPHHPPLPHHHHHKPPPTPPPPPPHHKPPPPPSHKPPPPPPHKPPPASINPPHWLQEPSSPPPDPGETIKKHNQLFSKNIYLVNYSLLVLCAECRPDLGYWFHVRGQPSPTQPNPVLHPDLVKTK